jgi:hypothetical protein
MILQNGGNYYKIILYDLHQKRQRYPITDSKSQRGAGIRSIALHSLDIGARRGGRSAPRPGRFTPWKDPVPIVREAG